MAPLKHISFSQINKYLTCPRSYKYYYVDRLREKTSTSFLAFGSAMDNALNAILLDYQQNGSVSIDYYKKFDEQWQTITINRRTHSLMDCPLVGYAKSDFIPELLTSDDVKNIRAYRNLSEDENITTLHKTLEELRSNRAHIVFSEEDQRLLNVINWHSLRRKGHLMLDAYVQDIMPQIEEVIDIQRKIELTSPCGTKLIGYIDAIVRFKGASVASVLDNKTSASRYDDAKLKFSPQLALYCYEQGLTDAAFGVMLKSIKFDKQKICVKCGNDGTGRKFKTCNVKVDGKSKCGGKWAITLINPRAETQLLRGPIKTGIQEMVVENAAEVLHGIKNAHFPRNLNTCQNIYGNPCPYIKLCYNKDDGGLEHVPAEKG